jgi:prepilin-type N-terminal cleavage/methylation domain-containing protein
MKILRKHQSGFTFVELIFAITIMGSMLAIAMVVVIGTLRFYVFSNQVRQNQENGRNIVDTMTRELRFGELVIPSATGSPLSPLQEICIVDDTNKQLIDYKRVGPNLVRTTLSYSPGFLSCDEDLNPAKLTKIITSGPINLDKMKVSNFSVVRTSGARGGNDKASAVTIGLSYTTGLPEAGGECLTGNIYCSGLTLNTAINLRAGTK